MKKTENILGVSHGANSMQGVSSTGDERVERSGLHRPKINSSRKPLEPPGMKEQ